MKTFDRVSGPAYALPQANIDTDVIIAAQRLRSIYRTGMGVFAFEKLRAVPDNVFDDPRFGGAPVLIAGANFGCGSSREHAVWAMADMGLRVVIAPSFGDIFFANAAKNGFLAIVLPQDQVGRLLEAAAGAREITVDLGGQTVAIASGEVFAFDIDPFQKACFMQGLDEIELSLKCAADISAYEERRRQSAPWLMEASVAP